jgi:hypothetical protein
MASTKANAISLGVGQAIAADRDRPTLLEMSGRLSVVYVSARRRCHADSIQTTFHAAWMPTAIKAVRFEREGRSERSSLTDTNGLA